jgi:asparagine synthase (glutamine-hydrolysing)
MGPFCGIVDIEHGFNRSADIESMVSAFNGGPSNLILKQFNEGAVFAQQNVHVTLESESDPMPLYDKDPDLTIVGDIRIDNRTELFAKLGISRFADTGYSDARLVLAAYQKWGGQCPEHLLGEFCFVIWDGALKQLFCSTDHMGVRNIFYYFDGEKFVFASSQAIIHAANGVSTGFNHNKLVGLIQPAAKHLFRDETWYKNIFPVPSASTLIVNKKGLHKHKYWTPEIGKELSFKSEADFTEAFQEVFFNAVGNRLRSNLPVTALLSGGLDSSAIVSVAAKILEKQGRELDVLSVVLPHDAGSSITDERYFIDQFRSFPNVKINYITAPGQGFFSGLDTLANISNDPNISSRHYLYTAFTERAGQLGSRVILEGLGGELGPTNYGDGVYAELFVKLRWLRLYNELRDRKALTGESALMNLRGAVSPLLPAFLTKYVKGKQPFPLSDICLIQQGLVAQLNDRVDSRELIHYGRPSWDHRVNQLQTLLGKQRKGFINFVQQESELRYPFMDKRLLEFCLALPLDLKVNKGYKRYTVRAGLNGILPPEIQWRNSKTPFSPDYFPRYNRQLPQVREFLNNIAANDPVREIVDIEKVKGWANYMIADTGNNQYLTIIARDKLPASIYLINFLRRFKEYQAI